MNIMPIVKKRKSTGKPVVITSHRGKLKIIDCENLQEVKQVLSKELKKYNNRAKHEALVSMGLTRCTVDGKTFYE